MTLNLGLLAWRPFGVAGVSIDSHIEERLAAAPACLEASGADIVALQEVYAGRDRRFLRDSLKNVYPHSIVPWRSRSILGSGLMILSRHPVSRAEFVRRRRAPGSHSAISEKGCLCAEIKVPRYGILRLINLHLSVGGILRRRHDAANAARRFAEIDEILAIAALPDRPPPLLVGDFNCGPVVNSDIYERLLGAGFTDAFCPAVQQRSEDAITWDRNNPLNATGRYRHCPSQRIDHVFVPSSLATSIIPLRSTIEFNKATIDIGRGRRVTLSDHYGLSASLALRVRRPLTSSRPVFVPAAHPKQQMASSP